MTLAGDSLEELVADVVQRHLAGTPMALWIDTVDVAVGHVTFLPTPTATVLMWASQESPSGETEACLTTRALRLLGLEALLGHVDADAGLVHWRALSVLDALALPSETDLDRPTPSLLGAPAVSRGGEAALTAVLAQDVIARLLAVEGKAAPHLDDTCRIHEIRMVLDEVASGDLDAPLALQLIAEWVGWLPDSGEQIWEDEPPF